VRTHRRNITKNAFETIPDRLLTGAKRIAALLRVAVLLHRSHEADDIPRIDARAGGDALVLILDKRWYEQRPLLRQDLGGEPDYMAGLGITLRIDAA
jgi:exopolyphosphatase/guanosine-5'-triphosphate,3'-diphosphate pyrophosphatase